MDIWPLNTLQTKRCASRSLPTALLWHTSVCVCVWCVCASVAMIHGARQAAVKAHAAGADLGDLPHALFKGRALSLNASSGEGGAGCACTCMLLADARRALPVSIWSGRRRSGSSTPAAIQLEGNAIVSIAIMNSRSRLGNRALTANAAIEVEAL